jgi:5'-3' exonuclease
MFKIGNLSWQEKRTGVIFGFLRTLLDLTEKFEADETVFCWDSLISYRRTLLPTYKTNRRRNLTEDDLLEREVCYKQFDELRLQILPRLGFANILHQEGIEADDLIAKFVINNGNGINDNIVVSSDNDLFQILDKIRGMYRLDKKVLYTQEDFIREKNIHPSDWLQVKTLMGDVSDNIPGVKGVGEKTALKHIISKGQYRSVDIGNNKALISLNRKLMTLPHPLTQEIHIVRSSFNSDGFVDICLENGFSHFLKPEQYKRWLKAFDRGDD